MSKVEDVARSLSAEQAKQRGAEVDWGTFEWTPNMIATLFPQARAAMKAMRDGIAERWGSQHPGVLAIDAALEAK